MHLNFGGEMAHNERCLHLGHLKPILKYKIGICNPKVSSLVAFHYFFLRMAGYLNFPARGARGAWPSQKTGLTKLAQFMLLG